MKMLFNEKLKELRVQSNLTQRKIAEMLNVAQVSYLKWEQGKTEPSITSIFKLCEIFDVTAGYLLGLEDEFGNKIKNDIF